MKFIKQISNFLFLVIILKASSAFSQQTTPIAAFLEKWENAKAYTLGIAEAMPEEFYDFKPAEGQMSFKEQLVHIKSNTDWLGSTYFSGQKPDGNTASKAALIKALSDSFDAVTVAVKATTADSLKQTVDFFAGPKSKLQILNLLQDHLTHHRGQLIVYLNLKQVAPPRYVGW